MSTYDNAEQVDGWTLPSRTWCSRLLGEDRCDCPDCQLAEHADHLVRGEN